MGSKEAVRADLFDVGLSPGDICLLCSDGLTNMVPDKEILRIVQEAKTLEDAGRILTETANRNGGSDNISIILVQPMERG